MARVLIVEDNDVFRTTLTDLLSLWRPDLKVIHASNGEEGIAAALKHHPDLILMDGNMPIMDGVSAMKKLRQQPETKDIPVIGMTARQNDFAYIARGLQATCNQFLTKPFDMMELINTIKSLHLH